MTGPQSMLLAGGDGYTDDPQYGEQTGEWIAGNQRTAAQGCTERLISEARAADAADAAEAPATRHARKRRFSFRPRRHHAPVTGTRTSLVADVAPPVRDGGEVDTGAVLASVIQRFPAAPEVSHEHDHEPTVAVRPAELADDLAAYAPPEPRPYAPPEARAIPWGTWDTDPGPLQPRPVLILAADLTELPAFRESMAMRTRNQAAECLCGDEMAGQTWGERMMREGIHMLSVWDLPVVRMLAALPPAAPEHRTDVAA